MKRLPVPQITEVMRRPSGFLLLVVQMPEVAPLVLLVSPGDILQLGTIQMGGWLRQLAVGRRAEVLQRLIDSAAEWGRRYGCRELLVRLEGLPAERSMSHGLVPRELMMAFRYQKLWRAWSGAPLVPAAVFEALARAWLEAGAPPRGWLAPLRAGRGGHPIVVGRELAAHLESSSADRPLRELRALAAPLLSLEVDAPEVLDDLDTPADLRALRERIEAR